MSAIGTVPTPVSQRDAGGRENAGGWPQSRKQIAAKPQANSQKISSASAVRFVHLYAVRFVQKQLLRRCVNGCEADPGARGH